MIAQLTIKNFRSILDMTLDFRFTEGKAPNGYKNLSTLPFLEDTAQNRIVPCLAIFGANASGKSNIIKAMSTFHTIVTNKDAALSDYFEPNKLHDGAAATLFELTAIHKDITYTYQLEYNGTEICAESLAKNDELLYQINRLSGEFAIGMPATGYTDERLQSILEVECSDGNGHQTVCFLRKIQQNYPGLNADLKKVFDFISNDILILGSNDITLPASVNLLKQFHSGDSKAALDEIVSIIRMLDFDIRSIDINHRLTATEEASASMRKGCFFRMLPDGKQMEVVDVRTYHRNTRGETVGFNFLREESDGTQRVSGLVGLILACVKDGKTLIVDELENSLHPLLLKELIRMFKDKRYNQSNAQIVFSTHNTDILDNAILRLGEVAIVRKTERTGTLARRLVDIKDDGIDVRNVTNFRKQYLDGFYSGIPHPAL